MLDAAVGAVDGFVVARSLTHRGKAVTSEKAAALRGNGFSGGVGCPGCEFSHNCEMACFSIEVPRLALRYA